jgi:hypothetical protein
MPNLLSLAANAATYLARSAITPTKLGVGLSVAENVAQKELGIDLPSASLNGFIGSGLADAMYTINPTDTYIAGREKALDAERIQRWKQQGIIK